jgi:hypothetical protein
VKAMWSNRFPAGSSPRRTMTRFRLGTMITYWPRLPLAEIASAGMPCDRLNSQKVAP